MSLTAYMALIALLSFIGGVCLTSLVYGISATEKRTLHHIIADLLNQRQLEAEVHKNMLAAGLISPEFEHHLEIYNLEAFLADPRVPRISDAPR